MAESSTPSQPTPDTPPGETFLEKAKRKTVEEPLVPIGMFVRKLLTFVKMTDQNYNKPFNRILRNYFGIGIWYTHKPSLHTFSGVFATVVAVTMASRQFRRGDRVSMNQWLRVRVAAQGFTLLAICTYGFALRWRKKKETDTVDASSNVDNPSILRGDGRGSIVGNVQVTPAALLREAAKEKEKGDFERRLEEAIIKDRAEQEHKESGKEKPDWKAAWKEGLLQKNRENDARRVRPAERKD
jgi:hypothetical protein